MKGKCGTKITYFSSIHPLSSKRCIVLIRVRGPWEAPVQMELCRFPLIQRKPQWQQNGMGTIVILLCLSFFRIAIHRGIIAQRLGQPLIHLAQQCNTTTTLQQLLLSWKCCSSMSTSSGADGVLSVVKRLCFREDNNNQQQLRAFVMLVVETWQW